MSFELPAGKRAAVVFNDAPYVTDVAGTPPMYMRHGWRPSEFVEAFKYQVAAVAVDETATFVDATAHCHVSGRPGGVAAFAEMIEHVRDREDIWVTTRQELAAWTLRDAAAGQ
jgi:hypothetical protein